MNPAMTDHPRLDQAQTLRTLTARRSTARPPILAVTSGKGGVGKTVLAVNLALRYAAEGRKTLLVDLDPGLANVDVHLRLQARRTVLDVLAGRCTIEDAILVGASSLMIVPGGSYARSGVDDEALRQTSGPARLLAAIGRLRTNIDLVVLDTGAGVGPWVRGALALADRTLVVTQPDPVSVTDAYAVVKVARSLRKDHVPGLAVNRVCDKREALLTATRIRSVAKRFLGFEPELYGWLHDQRDVETSIRNQVPFYLELPQTHRAVLDLAGLAARSVARLERA